MQHAPPILSHNPACSCINWPPSSAWGVLASLGRGALWHGLLLSPCAAGRGWKKLSAGFLAGNGQMMLCWGVCTTAHQWLRPLPAAFGKKLLLVLFYPSWAPAVMLQYWAGWSCSLGGSSLHSLVRHVAGHWSHWEGNSSGAAVAREGLASKSLLGMDGEAGIIHSCAPLHKCRWLLGTETHHYNRAPPGTYLFTLKHYYTNWKKEKGKKKRDNVLEQQVCQSQPPSLPTLSSCHLPLALCHDPCRKIPSHPLSVWTSMFSV